MTMRILLFTGKGGVGKTTMAAATATLAARRGLKTLAVSTDTAHSLGDTFGAAIGPGDTEVEAGLFVHQIDTQRAAEASWRELQDYLLELLDRLGIEEIVAQELTVLPGVEEVLALFRLREQVRSGDYDVVVVDCAPTAETLRLLALPEVLGWYMNRVLPVERRVVGALRPVLDRVAGVPMPRGRVFDAIEALHGRLADVRDILLDDATSVRLVLTPESVVVAEARRTFTSLSLYGYRVDAVLANRIFPAGTDPWLDRWASAQAAQLAEVDASFAPLPVYRAPYRPAEPVGPAELAEFGDQVYAGDDPLALPRGEPAMRVGRDGDDYVLDLALPGADRSTIDVARVGGDLVLTVGSYRRVIALPDALAGRKVSAALRGEDGRRRIRFSPLEADND